MASISQLGSIRTNINSFGGNVVKFNKGNVSTSSANLGGFGDDSISKFYKDLSELKLYQNAGICQTIIGIIDEYLNKFRIKSGDFITITEEGNKIPESDEINGILKSINFNKILSDSAEDRIYFGSYLYVLKSKSIGDKLEYEIVNLKFPYTSIVRRSGSNITYIINGEELNLGDGDYLPIRFGSLNKRLVGDLGSFTDNEQIETESYLASKPIFDGLVLELKLFILKYILTKLIQIQDIVSPNLLLAGVDKSTSSEKATELAREIETLINQYGDLTQLISANADINTLSNFILNNVRVYPDLLGVLRGTEKLDFTRLTGKNQEVRNELDSDEENLVNAVGIPIDLYRGRSTNKFEALRQSDRLLSLIQKEITTDNNSLVEFTINYLKSKGKYRDSLVIEPNLYDDSFISSINSSYKYETSTQYLSNLSALAKMIKDTVVETKGIFDSEKLVNKLIKTADTVYPGFSDLLDKDFSKNINKIDNDLGDLDE